MPLLIFRIEKVLFNNKKRITGYKSYKIKINAAIISSSSAATIECLFHVSVVIFKKLNERIIFIPKYEYQFFKTLFLNDDML